MLWYLDVEGLKPAQAAPLLGIEPNAVSALAVRAREALEQNWIQAQLAANGGTPECAVVDENIGGVVRRKVSKRAQTKIDAHVAGCARCTALIDEGRDIDNRLAAVLFPIATDVSAAALLGGELDAGAAAAAPVPPEIFEAPTRAVVVLSPVLRRGPRHAGARPPRGRDARRRRGGGLRHRRQPAERRLGRDPGAPRGRGRDRGRP